MHPNCDYIPLCTEYLLSGELANATIVHSHLTMRGCVDAIKSVVILARLRQERLGRHLLGPYVTTPDYDDWVFGELDDQGIKQVWEIHRATTEAMMADLARLRNSIGL